MEYSLIIPAFIAGFFTFFAPCTLPLVPGFLAFISGSSLKEINANSNNEQTRRARRLIAWNAVWYILGFSVIFIFFGVLFGLGGSALVQYRLSLARIGGAFVILFGLYLLGANRLKFLSFMNSEKRFHPGNWLKPGKPWSSFLFGATFAFGWSPCIGPILGSILFLASTTGTVVEGAMLLAVFSFGLAVPFMGLAIMIGSATKFMTFVNRWLPTISKIGGIFLIFLGVLLATDQLQFWTSKVFQWLQFINYDKIYDFL